MPAFADIFIDAFHHNDQVTPGHGVRTGGRIIGGYLEGAFFKQFLIKDQTARFGMEQFYLGPETVVENEYLPTSDVASHPLMHKAAKSEHTFPHVRITGAQEDPLNFNFNPLGNSKDISELSLPFKGKGTLGWGDGRGAS